MTNRHPSAVAPPATESIASNPGGPPRSSGGVVLCMTCRRRSACKLGIRNERVGSDGVVRYDVVAGRQYEGGEGVAHGGWTASVLDEVLGHIPMLDHRLSLTATLTVDYVLPIVLEQQLAGVAWVERRERSKWYIAGELRRTGSDDVVASAKGLYISRDGELL